MQLPTDGFDPPLSEAEFYRIIADFPHDWDDWLGPDGCFVYISPTCERITGRPVEQLKQAGPQSLLEMIHPQDQKHYRQHLEFALSGSAEDCQMEYRLLRPDGSLVWISHRCQAVYRSDGTWLGRRGSNQDITHHKRVHEELSESVRTISALLAQPIDLAVVTELDGTIRAVNQPFTHAVGKPAGQLIGQCLWDQFPPQITANRRAHFEQVVRTGQALRVEDIGQFGVYDTTVTPVLDDNGQVRRVAVLARDITERKKAEDSLRQSEALLRTIINHAPMIVSIIDEQGIVQFMDGKALNSALVSRSRLELLGRHMSQVFRDPQEAQSRLGRALAGEEFSVLDRSDSGRAFETRVAPLPGNDGKPASMVTISFDVTETQAAHADLEERIAERTADLERLNQDLHSQIERTQQAETALRREIGFVDRMIDTAQAIVLVTDIDGRITLINRFMEELLGYSVDEVKGMDWINTLLPEWDRERMRSRFQQALTEQRVRGNINPILTKSGEERQIEWFTSFLRDEDQGIIGLLAVGHDVTQRLAAEQQTKQNAARAEALARLAARVNAELDLQAVLDIVVQETIQAAHYPMCNVMLYNELTDALHPAAAAGELVQASLSSKPLPRAIYQEFLKYKSRYILLEDVSQLSSHFHGSMQLAAEVRTFISVPMLRDNELVGCLNAISTGKPRLPRADELDLLQALADQASTAIANARLFKEISEAQQRLKTLSQRLVQIQEEDRRALARELHDEFGQTLTSQILSLDAALATMDNQSEPAEKARSIVENTRQQTQSLLDQLREICLSLRPAQLDDLGLLPALQTTFKRFTAHTQIAVQFKHAGLDKRYPSEIETAVYRIIQEALTNVARYASVAQVAVILWSDGHTLRLQVEDEGIGFDLSEATAHASSSGLSGMRERAEACGGYLEIDTVPGEGACLTAEFPLAGEFELV